MHDVRTFSYTFMENNRYLNSIHSKIREPWYLFCAPTISGARTALHMRHRKSSQANESIISAFCPWSSRYYAITFIGHELFKCDRPVYAGKYVFFNLHSKLNRASMMYLGGHSLPQGQYHCSYFCVRFSLHIHLLGNKCMYFILLLKHTRP